ncbi:hypothetical protein TNCV_831141 [Trichonephila clavipes]|nr:hypothetical protein TNCV_831141 [Trichonephila clavipes]
MESNPRPPPGQWRPLTVAKPSFLTRIPRSTRADRSKPFFHLLETCLVPLGIEINRYCKAGQVGGHFSRKDRIYKRRTVGHLRLLQFRQ